jgi:hypothetical protein
MPEKGRCVAILMVLEGTLKVGASIQLQSGHMRISAMAKPNYRRRQDDRISSKDLLNTARTGETVEALADVSPVHSDFADLLYHDLIFQ